MIDLLKVILTAVRVNLPDPNRSTLFTKVSAAVTDLVDSARLECVLDRLAEVGYLYHREQYYV